MRNAELTERWSCAEDGIVVRTRRDRFRIPHSAFRIEGVM